jgi:Cytochrome c554 and c-prime
MNLLKFYLITILVIFISCGMILSQDKPTVPLENFYNQSLHYTNRGIEFLCAKEQGGLERLTGLSAAELGCMQAKCHVQSCDECHEKQVNGKSYYSLELAKAQQVCSKCHPVAADDPDVHFQAGMKCLDCHTTRELHGDGIVHNTYMEPGFFDTSCEKCHTALSQITSHTVHQNKVSCEACHTRDFITCLNCHVDTRIKENKDVQIEVKDLIFLINHDGKVTTGNLLTYVYQKKTMITLAPYFSHSIKKEGRGCPECHNTSIVNAIRKNRFTPFKWEDGQIRSISGVIPAIDGMKWDLIFLDYQNGKWSLISDPAQPLLNYSGYGTPLSTQQFAKLAKAQKMK